MRLLDRMRLLLLGRFVGVSHASEQIITGQSWIVGEQFALGLSGGEEFEYELNRQSRTSDHWLASQYLRIGLNALG